ncbi:MAG: alpha/beta fold hydrolase, partial [Candidatus Hodarchaeales archaeon]
MKHFRKYGLKPYEIVCVHGGPGAAGEMAPLAKELSSISGVLEPIQTKDSIDGQIEELREIVEKYGELPIVLIGFSWGAWLSCLTAAEYPSLVKKLILVASGPFEERYVAKIHEIRMSRLDRQEREEFDQVIKNLVGTSTKDKNSSLETLVKLMSKTDQYEIINDGNQ